MALAIGALHEVSGGAERVLVDVANGLHERGYTVSVFTYEDRTGPSFYPLAYGISRLDGRVRHLEQPGRTRPPLEAMKPVARRRPWFGWALWFVQYVPRIRRLRRLIRIGRPDVVVGFLPSTFPYLVLAATTTRTPVIASIHNVPDHELGGDPDRWDQNPADIAVRRKTLEMADATTVLLPSFVEQLPSAVRPTTFVVPNMVHGFGGRVADVSAGPRNTILAVGRLVPAKGHEVLIRAWADLEDRFPDWSVRIIGDGRLEPELRQQITKLGLERLVIDPPTREIEAAYLAAKFVVMPSVHEGFGLVTVEAMACGLPVIGFSDCEGTNEIVVDGTNGLLVDPGDDRAASLGDAMATLMSDHELRATLAGAAPASIARFGKETVIDDWERVILSVLAAPTTDRSRP